MGKIITVLVVYWVYQAAVGLHEDSALHDYLDMEACAMGIHTAC